MNAKQQQFERFAKSVELHGINAMSMREAAQGHARYEVLRCLNPREFTELYMRGVAGERFDDMVDDLVKEKNEPE